MYEKATDVVVRYKDISTKEVFKLNIRKIKQNDYRVRLQGRGHVHTLPSSR